MLALLVILLLLSLIMLGIPVALALGIAGTLGLYLVGGPDLTMGMVRVTPLSKLQSYELVTLPMFVLMANLILKSRIGDELFAMASAWVGRVPGGLGHATALTGAAFGALSGSSTASAATLSSTSIPGMIKQGYDPETAAGIVAISGTLAMLIPPSIAMVIYALTADENIGVMLIAGLVPGIVVMFVIVTTIVALCYVNPSKMPKGEKFSFRDRLRLSKPVAPFLFLFAAVTGTIYSGVATPTEASGLGAATAFILALQRRVPFRDIADAFIATLQTSCMIMFIVVGAIIFGHFITLTQVTQDIVTMMDSLQIPPVIFLSLVLLLLLMLGCFMDQIAIILLVIPIVLPVIVSYGYSPIWFGVVAIVMAEIGLVTPPLGLNAFVVSQSTGLPIIRVFRGLLPHIAAHLLAVVLFCMFPELILWLPEQMAR